MALTPGFVFDLESNMKVVAAQEYQRMTADLYWTRLAKKMASQSKRERLIWMLDTATIQYVNRLGGEEQFDELVTNTTEFVNKAATAALKLNRSEMEDLDGGGLQQAAQWARQQGAYGAYWPQKQVAKAIINNGTGYDAVAFFATNHPLNPFDSSLGTYSNLHASRAIDESVTIDVAVKNVQLALTDVANLKMPNGVDPRFLKVVGIMGAPALAGRLQQLTGAKFIGQAATGGAGSSDVERIVRNWGFGEPIIAPELAAAFGGSDTAWYLITAEMVSDQVGALVYVEREPFSIIYNDQMTSAQLARANELQWLIRGRNVVGYGHPYLLHKFTQ